MGGIDTQERLGLMMPRHLDDETKFLWWDFQQVLIVAAVFMLGIVLGMILTGVVLAGLSGWAIGRVKSGRGRGFMVHTAYWYMPVNMGMEKTPPSSITRFVG